jgi:hypothetical protein
VPEAWHGKLSLFILAGQSNMSGRGELPLQPATHPQVFVFGNDYRWTLAVEPIDRPDGQVDTVSQDTGDDPAGFSPGVAFATSLLKHDPQRVIGLIPCAKGDTAIAAWQRSLSDQTLYGACLKRIGAAATMGDLAGVLVFQGEADALDPHAHPDRVLSAGDYATTFTTFVHDLRSDLARPQLPVVFAQIGTTTAPDAFIHWETVKAQQATVQLPCAAMITTDDLPLQDAVHFTTDSYRQIGARFAAAFRHLVQMEACR